MALSQRGPVPPFLGRRLENRRLPPRLHSFAGPRQPETGHPGVGCGKGRNDTLSVEGPLFVVPRSSLHEAFPTNTSLSWRAAMRPHDPSFHGRDSRKSISYLFTINCTCGQRFRDCEDITHEPHWLRSSIHRRRPPPALKNALRIGRQGEIRDRSTEGQHYRMAGLNLLAAIVIYWNTARLGEAVARRRHTGLPVVPEFLPHISPLGWAHILLTGEYRWQKR